MNKIIVIEGTDCSGKETQSNLLLKRMNEENINIEKLSFPNYDSPTGKIVGGSYLGKPEYGECVFPEGAINVDSKVASLYYAADRLYNKNKIEEIIKKSNLILDRYVESNMAHQGGKIKDREERYEMYNFLKTLEYDLLKLPKPDMVVFLYMPYQYALELKKNRVSLDQHELSEEHLKSAENTYLELSKLYNYEKINCVSNDKIRTIEDINDELYQRVKKLWK